MSSSLDRRHFLASSLGGMAAAMSWNSLVLAKSDEEHHHADTDDADTLVLTWQRDPTTTMTIQWVGSETRHDASIQYAPLDQKTWMTAKTKTKPFTNTDLKVFRCELTGLEPGGEYRFQIASGSPTYRFRTMPAKATNPIQFVSGGDCGVNEHVEALNIIAGRQNPQFVLIGGDLAYDNGKSPETFRKFLKNYHRHVVDSEGRLIPMISCIGNHEVIGGHSGSRKDAPQYLDLFDGLFAETTYGVLDIGDYMSLVLLDTGHIAPIAGEQTDWLAQTLAARRERPHVIVASHVPAYPSYRPPVGENGKGGSGEEQRVHWCPLFERYNVDFVLEHHDHTFKRTFPLLNGMKDDNGIVYLGDGSWGKLRVPKTPEERPYLARSSSNYHMSVHRFEGADRFHVALEENGRIADICRTSGKRAAT
jgi:hypothetical protein